MSLCCANIELSTLPLQLHALRSVVHFYKVLHRVYFHGYIFMMASVKFLIISSKIVSKWYFHESTFVIMLVSV